MRRHLRGIGGNQSIIGIDEVGRGSLAGPVTVVAVLLGKKNHFSTLSARARLPLRDSKRLTQLQRERWHRVLYSLARGPTPRIAYAVASVSAAEIDKTNITRAANRAASRAFIKLVHRCGVRARHARIFLDGGLFLTPRARAHMHFPRRCMTVPHGDRTIVPIMLASIVAKVSRDARMAYLNRKYEQYDFNKHKGYGTRAHIRAIRRFGPSRIHRKTFISHL